LDHPDIDLLLEQVRGEAVPQGVHRDALVDARSVCGLSLRVARCLPLNAAAGKRAEV
jgi:hypothetical protein